MGENGNLPGRTDDSQLQWSWNRKECRGERKFLGIHERVFRKLYGWRESNLDMRYQNARVEDIAWDGVTGSRKVLGANERGERGCMSRTKIIY